MPTFEFIRDERGIETLVNVSDSTPNDIQDPDNIQPSEPNVLGAPSSIINEVVLFGNTTGDLLAKSNTIISSQIMTGLNKITLGSAVSKGTVCLFTNENDLITIQAPNQSSDYILTLPIDDGIANQQLTTDGNGVLSWETPVVGVENPMISNLDADDFSIFDLDEITLKTKGEGNDIATLEFGGTSGNITIDMEDLENIITTSGSTNINRLAIWADSSGKQIKQSSSILDNAGSLSGIVSLTAQTLTSSNIADVLSTEIVNHTIATSAGLFKKSSGVPDSTGLIEGGILSINGGDSDLVDVSAGQAHFYDPVTKVSKITIWAAQIGLVHGGSGTQTFVNMDNTGTVQFAPTTITNTLTRDLVQLGHVIHFAPPALFAANNEQVAINNPANMIRDLSLAIGFINVSGNVCSSNNLLTLAKTSGKVHAFGLNYAVNESDPNITNPVAIDTNVADIIFRFWQDDSLSGAVTDIVPGEYDDGNGFSSPGTVASNQWTVKRIFLFPNLSTVVQQGQFLYGNKDDAVAAIATEGFVAAPTFSANAVLISFLAVKGNATDLSVLNTAEFFTASKFGSVSNSGGGGDVFGPVSAVSQRIATFTDTTGKLIGDSGIIIDGGPSISGVLSITSNTSDPFTVTDTTPVTVNSIALYTQASGRFLHASTNITIDGSDNLIGAFGIAATDRIQAPNIHIEEIGGGGSTLKMQLAVSGQYTIIWPADTELPATDETKYLTLRNGKLSWDDNNAAPLPKGYLDGGKVAWNSVSQISFDAIVCRSNTNTKNLQRSNTTLNMATSGLLGIQTGSSEASSTWYELLVIGDLSESNPDSAIFLPVGTGFSQSGYDLFRRIATVRNNSSSDLLKFTNPDSASRDRIVMWDEEDPVLRVLNNGTATSYATVDLSSLVPPTARQVYLDVSYSSDTQTSFVQFRNADSTITSSAIRVFSGHDITGGIQANSQFLMNCNGSQEIQYKSFAGHNAFTSIWVLGYIDNID